MKRVDKNEILQFQSTILTWYAQNKRDLAWRRTTDPYAILVSEVMSQQTQISRVVSKYLSWLEVFPTLADLANAPVSKVLTYWSGLGYNRRALYLQKAAQVLFEDYNGVWPKEPAALEKLPGIGKYTASAIACFAFNAQIPVIDTNIRKVIAVTFKEGVVPSEKEIEALAWELLPIGKAKDWNQALMDYAGVVLKKEKIALPKQSKFLGSNRWYRGDVLKILTRQDSITITELAVKWKKNTQTEDRVWIEKLLFNLEKEGFIRRSGEQISLL